MHIVVYLFFFVTKGGFLLAASDRRGNPTPRIIGGHDAVPYKYPYIVSLQIRFLWVRAHYCGGSLINENWILTAGHCIKGSWLLYLLPIEAVAGAHDVDEEGPTVQVIRTVQRIPHPNYNGDIGPHDIGLLKTRYPFKLTAQVQPIQLPDIQLPKNRDQSLTLVGWGVLRTTFFFPDLPSKLQEVQMKYLPFEECYNAVEEILEYGESNPLDKNANICTGPITGGIAACSGDSGGPLIQYIHKVKDINEIYDVTNDLDITDAIKSTDKEIEEYTPVIVGVVSWGATPCGEKGAPTVYTNVTDYINFITNTINL